MFNRWIERDRLLALANLALTGDELAELDGYAG